MLYIGTSFSAGVVSHDTLSVIIISSRINDLTAQVAGDIVHFSTVQYCMVIYSQSE